MLTIRQHTILGQIQFTCLGFVCMHILLVLEAVRLSQAQSKHVRLWHVFAISFADRSPAALNWPNHRGTATAFPLSAFGLSAFFFATISSLAFPDNTSDLLLLLAALTFAMCFISGFFLRVIPHSEGYSIIPNPIERSISNSSNLLERTKSEESRHSTGRLSYEPGMQSETDSFHDDTSKAPAIQLNESEAPNLGAEETSSLLSKSSGSGPGDIPYRDENAKPTTGHDSHRLDIRGLALLSKTKFWQLWIMMGLLAGIGLMTIK